MLAFPTLHYHLHSLLSQTVNTHLDNGMVHTIAQVVSHQFLTKGDPGTVTGQSIHNLWQKEYHRSNSLSPNTLVFCCSVQAIDCSFALSLYLTENTASVIKITEGYYDRYVSLYVKCLLFQSNLKQNWNVLINFSQNSEHEISPKYILWKSHCSMRVDVVRSEIIFNCFANLPN